MICTQRLFFPWHISAVGLLRCNKPWLRTMFRAVLVSGGVVMVAEGAGRIEVQGEASDADFFENNT